MFLNCAFSVVSPCNLERWLKQQILVRGGKGGRGVHRNTFHKCMGKKTLGPLLIHCGVSFPFSNERNGQLNSISHSFDFSFVLKIIVSQNH